MLKIDKITAFKVALFLVLFYIISMGIVGLINFQFQSPTTTTTSELLDSLYLILNSLFFILTLLLIKLFMDNKQIEELS